MGEYPHSSINEQHLSLDPIQVPAFEYNSNIAAQRVFQENSMKYAGPGAGSELTGYAAASGFQLLEQGQGQTLLPRLDGHSASFDFDDRCRRQAEP